MATWQFDLHCVPRAAVLERFGQLPLTVSRADLHGDTWWESASAPADMQKSFDAMLPSMTSWSPSIEMWGEDAGNRIDVVKDAQKVKDVYVRIDVRDINYTFLQLFLNFSQRSDWILLTQDSYVLPPSLSKLLSAIRRSDAFKFVVDPEDFLRRLHSSAVPEYIRDDLSGGQRQQQRNP